ncbi:MAG: DHH family phosphoesterase [Bacillota bacterium]|nr:DHH family phosphoesterase [Bacillota bacterium]
MYAGRIERLICRYSPIPMCSVNMQGKITRAGRKIDEVFKYDGIIEADIFALTGIKLPEILEAAKNGTGLYLERNDHEFKILSEVLGEGELASVFLYFFDVTAHQQLMERYKAEKMCVALVSVDNFDELSANAGEEREVELTGEIDRFVRSWASKLEAAVFRYREHLYGFVFTHENLRSQIKDNFSILDEARKIESETDFPVTLSVGIGIGGQTPASLDRYAQDALDIALGRGGDQAVIRDGDVLEYYGGKTQGFGKSNKGKSRIIAHALTALMKQSRRVFIMGHANPDMDCFGASLGINRIAKVTGTEAYIVLGDYDDTLSELVEDARATGDCQFVSEEKAVSLFIENSLVVVLDTHRPGLVACPELLEKTSRLAVIDHHRRAEDVLPHQTLSYMEPNASSASELVAEVIQYSCDRKTLSKVEADGLLAGIMLDTNRFAVKTSVRTFEAASWLRRAGADPQTVRRYFQANSDNFRAKAACVANARILDGGIAMSVYEGRNVNSQIVNSQVADELLTIKGVEASFVAGQDASGATVVSARSLGNINVQRIMEMFGGGGHLNTAGAKVDMPPQEILKEIEEFFKTSQ